MSERHRALGGLWPYVRPFKYRLVQGFALLALTNALEKTIPWLLKQAINGLERSDFETVGRYAVWVIAFAVVMAGARTLSRVRIFNVGRDVEFELRNRLLGQLHRLGPSFYGRLATGEIMSRAINDLGQVRLLVGFGILNSVNSLLSYSIALGFMLSMSPELTACALLPYPLLILATRTASRALFKRSAAAQKALGELSSRVQETLSGIRVVKSFGVEGASFRVFEEANQNTLRRNMSLVALRGLMWPLLMGIGSAGTLLVLWRGTGMVREGEISVGGLVAFLAYGELLRWPTMGLGYILTVVQRGRASYGRIREILESEPDVAEVEGARAPGDKGELVVQGLSYSIGDRRILDDISFAVPAESSLAVVGRTGSGKSTLAALLPRLLPTPRGSVFLDGDDITELKLEELRKRVGYAQQDPFLFSDSAMRNIGYALPSLSAPGAAEQIRNMAAEARVLNEIEELPRGMDTMVGERGVQLSGGQKQRIALARALLGKPRVLVMDDPLSAVDAETENEILGALKRAGEGRTVVLITNRVAAAAQCDRIAVLDGGRIVEQGVHEELVKAGGLYAAIAARQNLEQKLGEL